ncbi:MAG: hydroxymethylbilane synthase [Planctomycetota bacterium]
MSDVLRLGTRGSALARRQADWVAGQLQEAGIEVEMVLITTQGDERGEPLGRIGGQGVFTKEIQRALLDHRVDLAVHSLKDLPTEPVNGLEVAAVPRRESAADVLVSRESLRFDALADAAVIGTGSPRRQAQLLHARGDLNVRDIRGNVETRLRRLGEGSYDAIVLAEAGLKRLGLTQRVTEILPPSWMLPAIGQGALGLEIRAADRVTGERVACLDHAESRVSVMAERVLLATLQGGCLAPIGAWARVRAGELHLEAAVLDPRGETRLFAYVFGPPEQAEELGREAARRLLSQGARDLIAAARKT